MPVHATLKVLRSGMRRETTTPSRKSSTVCKGRAHALAAALTPASCAGAVAEEAAREPSGGHDSGKARVACPLCAARASARTHKAGVRRSRVRKRERSAAWTEPTTCHGTG